MRNRVVCALLLCMSLLCLVGCQKENCVASSESYTVDTATGTGSLGQSLRSLLYNSLSADDGVVNEGTGQKLARTVNIALSVEDDIAGAVDSVTSMVQEGGGYVENNYSRIDGRLSHAYLRLRVPENSADDLLSWLKDSYELMSVSDSNVDVTLQYEDLSTRLRVKQEMREKYFDYLDEASTVEEALSIESKILGITEDIESYQSSLRQLENKIDYTTINVSLCLEMRALSIVEMVEDRLPWLLEGVANLLLDICVLIVYAVVVLAFAVPIGIVVVRAIVWLFKLKKCNSNKFKLKEEDTTSDYDDASSDAHSVDNIPDGAQGSKCDEKM